MIRLISGVQLIAGIAVSATMISDSAQAGSGEINFDTTSAYCAAACNDYPPGKCGARFIPSETNPDYGLCQMAVIEGGSLAQPPQAVTTPLPQASTNTPPQAATNNGGYSGGSPQGGQGFMQYMKPVTDPDKARELQQGLGVAPHTPSSGDNTLLGN
jgi:hypothetical protein